MAFRIGRKYAQHVYPEGGRQAGLGPKTFLQSGTGAVSLIQTQAGGAFAVLPGAAFTFPVTTPGSKFIIHLTASFIGISDASGLAAFVAAAFDVTINGVPQPTPTELSAGGISITNPAGDTSLPGSVALTFEVPNPILGGGAATFQTRWKVLPPFVGTSSARIDPTVAGNGQHGSLTVEEVTV
jgi:hypothetical protein